MSTMIRRFRFFLFRFGQVSSLVMIAALAMAAAPMVHAGVEAPSVSGSPVIEPPVRARPEPMVRVISFERPLPGRGVNSPFGLRRLSGEPAARMHRGVDFAAPEGSPVLASTEGVVTRTGEDAGYGVFVEIRHANGVSTFYGHLSAIEPGVRDGVRVGAGQPIGRVGSTGYSTGPHLHFEVRRRGERLDPGDYLGRQFVLRGPRANV